MHSDSSVLEKRLTALALALAFLALWRAWLPGLSPAFPPNDSPETIAAAWQLGIQHPPGYPLHTMLGRLACVAWPVGGPALRVNQFSALLGAACCLGLALLTARLLKPLPWALRLTAGLGIGLWAGFGATFWQQVGEAKGGVYLLNYLFTLALLFTCLSAWQERARPWQLRLFGLLAGLSLAHHAMSALPVLTVLGPLLAYKGLKDKTRGWAWAGAFLLLGLSPYLLLPLRAGFDPITNIGDPRTWNDFLWVVLRKGYTQAQIAHDATLRQRQLAHWLAWARADLGLLLWPLALAGAWLSFKRSKPAFLALAGIFTGFFIAVVFINATEAGVEWLMDLFFLPGQMAALLLAGLGLGALLEALARRGAAWAWVALLLALGPALSTYALNRADGLARARDLTAYDFGRGVLASLPRDALLLAEGDFFVMPLYHLRGVEGRRPDAGMTLPALLHLGFERRQLRRRRPDLAVAEIADGRSMAQALARDNAGRVPVLLTPQRPTLDGLQYPGLHPSPHGLLERLLPPGVAAAFPGPLPGVTLRSQPPGRREPLVRELLPWLGVSWANLGTARLNARDGRGAAWACGQALGCELPGHRSWLWHNLGQARLLQGDRAGARAAYAKALELEPGLSASADALRLLEMRRP